MDDLDKKKTPFKSVVTTTTAGTTATVLTTANADVVVTVAHAPLRIAVAVRGVETMAGGLTILLSRPFGHPEPTEVEPFIIQSCSL